MVRALTLAIIAATLVIIGVITPIITTTPVMGQFAAPPGQSIPSTETTTNTTTATTTTTPTAADYYTDSVNGVRVQVPDGWVVDYVNNTNANYEQTLEDDGLEFLITMCPQEQALPLVGRTYTCPFSLQNTSAAIQVYRFVDLNTRPELAALLQQNESITIDDLVAVFIDYQRNSEVYQSMGMATNEAAEVNIIDFQTNQTVGTAKAKFVEFTHAGPFGIGIYKQSALLVLSNDTNTGYVVRPQLVRLSNQEMPDIVRQVLDSFELVVPLTTNIAARTTPSPSQGQPQPQQQQLEQSDGGLTARLDAANFTYGDTITVNGTVRERGPNTVVTIDVIDPEGQTVEFEQARITADNRFTHSFVANERVGLEKAMVTSGNYLMSVQFGPDRVEFTFNYNATETASSEATSASTTTDSISIPQGSSTLTTDAYQPNPVQVSVGDTVTWTNDDAQPHTATSGENLTPDGNFDSGIMAPAATFEHTFTEAGVFPYFCLLHPNMVGTVQVMETSALATATNATSGANTTTIKTTDANVTNANTPTDTSNIAGTNATVGAASGSTSVPSVSIVLGSSFLTDEAFQPNPVRVSVGTTVTWTNEDMVIHTVTSGENLMADGQFDSGIMNQGDTFEHTFTQAGEFPYQCMLHPNQVGTVIVS